MLAMTEQDDPNDSEQTRVMRPEHNQVIALRIQGRSWQEICQHLRIHQATLFDWRKRYPEIDEAIAQASQDLVDAAAHGMASLLPLTVDALRDVLEEGTNFEKLAATKQVLDALKAPDRGGRLPQAVDAQVRQVRELTPGEVQAELERRSADPDDDPGG